VEFITVIDVLFRRAIASSVRAENTCDGNRCDIIGDDVIRCDVIDDDVIKVDVIVDDVMNDLISDGVMDDITCVDVICGAGISADVISDDVCGDVVINVVKVLLGNDIFLDMEVM
jgi:hypothetical protein